MIYIDSNYCCHTTNPDGTFREVDDPFFDGKCTAFVEGHRFVPFGESWVRYDGEVFEGRMITALKNYDELDSAQQEYERQLLADYESALGV